VLVRVLGVHTGSCSSIADAVPDVNFTGDFNLSNKLPWSLM